MSDYLVTDTELTSIANAIRTKGGTQAQLSFPTEFVSAINAISGGGGGLTLLATKPLGTINTSNTSQEDTGQTITVTGLNAYDLLVIETSVATATLGRHVATICVALIAGNTLDATTSKSGVSLPSAVLNVQYSASTTKLLSKYQASQYGVYTYLSNITWSNTDDGSATFKIYVKYGSSQTSTINGDYTMRVYGANLLQLIGG